jgi:hypothetical protein
LPPDFDLERSNSLGLKMVRNLTRQIRGEIVVERGEGTSFTILFPTRADMQTSRILDLENAVHLSQVSQPGVCVKDSISEAEGRR